MNNEWKCINRSFSHLTDENGYDMILVVTSVCSVCLTSNLQDVISDIEKFYRTQDCRKLRY